MAERRIPQENVPKKGNFTDNPFLWLVTHLIWYPIQKWWSKVLWMAVGFTIFIYWPYFIHYFYPKSGVYEGGVLMKIPFVFVCYWFVESLIEFYEERIFKVYDKYMNPNAEGNDFAEDFNSKLLTPSQRMWLYTVRHSVSLLVCGLLFLAL